MTMFGSWGSSKDGIRKTIFEEVKKLFLL